MLAGQTAAHGLTIYMSTSATNFLHALAGVLGGNALYFAFEKYLPPAARHAPMKMDLGMVVDFWFCLVIFGVIKTVAGRRRRAHPPEV
jgi:hypothetical protein